MNNIEDIELLKQAKEHVNQYISTHKLPTYILEIANSVALADVYHLLESCKEAKVELYDNTYRKLIDKSINRFKKHDRFPLYVPKKEIKNNKCVDLDDTTYQDALRRTEWGHLEVFSSDGYGSIGLISDLYSELSGAFMEKASKNGKRIATYLYNTIIEQGQWRAIPNIEIATALGISTRTVARQRKILNEMLADSLLF